MNPPNIYLFGGAAYVLVINCATFVVFASDKRRAVLGLRRIRESDLLGWVMLGGSIGALVAQQTLRHKTLKEPFRSRLIALITAQILVCAALLVFSASR